MGTVGLLCMGMGRVVPVVIVEMRYSTDPDGERRPWKNDATGSTHKIPESGLGSARSIPQPVPENPNLTEIIQKNHTLW